jgi:anthranilate 1,2-dioxygenase ferredoxin subunit
MTFRRLCSTRDVVAGQPLRAELDGVGYAVIRLDDRIHVIADLCTHGPGLLSDGYLLDDEIECPFHQGRFHVPSGRPTEPPCTEPIRVWTVRVEGDDVCIDPEEPPPAT